MFHHNKDIYEGEFINNQADGFGKYTLRTGEYYLGYFEKDQPSAKGKQSLSDGSYYEGEFSKNSIKHGYGTFRWPNGDVYKGQWING